MNTIDVRLVDFLFILSCLRKKNVKDGCDFFFSVFAYSHFTWKFLSSTLAWVKREQPRIDPRAIDGDFANDAIGIGQN